MRYLSMAALLCCLSVSTVFAQGQFEVPGSGSSQSGIGIVSGWKCTAGAVTVQFDNGPTYQAGYGTIRTDTQGVCGDTNNGWSFLWNWNKLGDRQHTVKVFDNGVQFGLATIAVQTLGAEFRTGLSKSVTVSDFPGPGQTATLQWQEGQQNFVIAGVTGGGGNQTVPNVSGNWHVTATLLGENCNFIGPGDLPSINEILNITQSSNNLSTYSGPLAMSGTVEVNGHFSLFSDVLTNTAGSCTYGGLISYQDLRLRAENSMGRS